MQEENAVLRLRKWRIAKSSRPFQARGGRVIRCSHCLLPRKYCLCHTVKSQRANSRFCLVMFDTEPMKPSNTGRLIADILPDTEAFLWSRTTVEPQLLDMLADPLYQPYVVFPASYSPPERSVTEVIPTEGKRPLFILLDGTWPEARKMFRKSPYLDKFPVISVDVEDLTGYLLRDAAREEQRCTAEVAVSLLNKNEDYAAATALADHFQRFRTHYLTAKNRLKQTIPETSCNTS